MGIASKKGIVGRLDKPSWQLACFRGLSLNACWNIILKANWNQKQYQYHIKHFIIHTPHSAA
jgi:hypothetical protein